MMETSEATANAGCDSWRSTAEEKCSTMILGPMPTAAGIMTNADRDASYGTSHVLFPTIVVEKYIPCGGIALSEVPAIVIL